MSPDATSSTKAMATWPTTRTRCPRSCSAGVLDAPWHATPDNGNRPEQQTCPERAEQRECDDRRPERDLVQPGQAIRAVGDEETDSDVGQAEPQRPAHESQGQALGELLPRDPAPTSAERSADGELLLACLGPNEDEIRHVCADEQHQQAQSAHQDAESHPDISDHIVLQRASVGCHGHFLEQFAYALVLSPIPPDASDVRIRLRDTKAWFQPTDTVVTELVGPVGGQALREEDVRRQVYEAKIARHDADDLVRNKIDDHRPAENLPVASESPLPVAVGEDHRSRAAR